jgi:transposase
MDIVHPRVAGIDVHKKVLWVAVRLPGQAPGERAVTVRRFKTFWRPLRQMAAWLAELGVSDAALESTGVYWWPACHALAQAGIEVCVCNAAHMRNVPGRKTDLRDCQRIAELHEHGLLRTGFIPDAQVVAAAAAPFAALIARLVTIPGVGQRTAEVIIAETGGDMARFATAARLAAWAGLAPGDNESAGKRKNGAAYRNRTDDLRITRGPRARSSRSTCANFRAHRSDCPLCTRCHTDLIPDFILRPNDRQLQGVTSRRCLSSLASAAGRSPAPRRPRHDHLTTAPGPRDP